MPISLPPEIFALMTTTVQWEQFLEFDGYAQPSYAPAIPLTCWIEPHGAANLGGQSVLRNREGTVIDPDIDMYFDGDDCNARAIRLWDRFTPDGVASEGRNTQALAVNTMLGPPFDNARPWLVIVSI